MEGRKHQPAAFAWHPNRTQGCQVMQPGERTFLKVLIFSLFCLFFLMQSGCVMLNSNESQATKDTVLPPNTILPPDYAIQPGDMLNIAFLHNSELNERLPVRPDGKIALQLIGEQDVYNLTVPELRKIIETKYDTRLASPEVRITIESSNSRIVYVDGEVNKPGIVKIRGTLSVMQSLSEVGGLKSNSLNKEVIIIRRNNGRPDIIVTNLMDCLEKDIPLKPYDIVYVPATMIEAINLWISDYIRTSFPITYKWNYDLTTYE